MANVTIILSVQSASVSSTTNPTNMPKAKETPIKQVNKLIDGVAATRPSMDAAELEKTANSLKALSEACQQQAAQLRADRQNEFMAPFNALVDTYWYLEYAGYQEVIHRELRHYVSCKLNPHRLQEGRLSCDVQSLSIYCTNLLPTSKLFGKKARATSYGEQFGFNQRINLSDSFEYHQDLVRYHRCQTTKEVFERVLARTTEQAQEMTELMVGLITNGDPVVAGFGRKLVIPNE